MAPPTLLELLDTTRGCDTIRSCLESDRNVISRHSAEYPSGGDALVPGGIVSAKPVSVSSAMTGSEARRLEFGDFVLYVDPPQLEKRKQSDGSSQTPPKVQPLPLKVMVFLAQHANRNVSREQLHDAIWVGKPVTDNAIDQAVSKAKTALNGMYITSEKNGPFCFRCDDVRKLPDSAPEISVANRQAMIRREIIDVTNSIARHAEEFVGREFISRAVTEFLSNTAHKSGYFVLQGEPGVGKSAFSAAFVKRTDCVAHFVDELSGINRTSHFLRSVAAQVIDRYGLPYSELPSTIDQDGAFLIRVLEEASSQLKPTQQLIIAVDALDEIDPASQSTRANILYLPPNLPTGVFFLLTSRRADIGQFTTPVERLRFDDEKHHNDCRLDAKKYIHKFAEDRLNKWMRQQKLSLDEFTNLLLETSGTNFMCLHHVLRDVGSGRYKRFDTNVLPTGLEDYYVRHWRRMGMQGHSAPRDKLLVIYVLSQLPSVSCRRIADATQLDDLRVQQILNEWNEFLHIAVMDGENCYSIYHKSFRDFLHRNDIVEAAGRSLGRTNGDLLRMIDEKVLRTFDPIFEEELRDAAVDNAKSRRSDSRAAK